MGSSAAAVKSLRGVVAVDFEGAEFFVSSIFDCSLITDSFED